MMNMSGTTLSPEFKKKYPTFNNNKSIPLSGTLTKEWLNQHGIVLNLSCKILHQGITMLKKSSPVLYFACVTQNMDIFLFK